MKKTLHKIVYCIISIFFFCALLAVDFVSTAKSVFSVSADETQVVDYDATDISNDLKDLDITEYPKNMYGKHQVVLFMEYCYSERAFLKESYGLYLYVYNPTEIAVRTENINNVANMATAYNSSGEPSAYSNVELLYLDATDNHRFYKFKILDSDRFLTLAESYAKAHDGKRRYDVAGVQLVFDNGHQINSNDETVAKTYTYTGFAAGLDSKGTKENTLQCEVLGFKTLSLDVHPTQWQPVGYTDPDKFAKDSLHSVYFSVPNDMIAQYGELVALRGTFLNAVLKPALVTGNVLAYDVIKPFLGKTIGDHTDELKYVYLGEPREYVIGGQHLDCPISYNAPLQMPIEQWYDIIDGNGVCQSDERLAALYLMFYARGGATNYTVKSETIKAAMSETWKLYGGNRISGAEGDYSDKVFESIDEKLSTFYVRSTDEYELNDIRISQNIWGEWFDDYEIAYSDRFENIKAIEKVTENVLKKDEEAISSELYIGQSDVSDFVDYCEKSAKNNSTVYIFRYRKSTYNVYQATLFERDTWGIDSYVEVDKDAYFFQSSCDLNFDIIEATFDYDGVETVIAVV
ncbi:MAG: hypothetical protein IJW60_04340, partial [Clostridia bacterium]|nr:hypothetical protein [Clostridia bacterium]